MYVLHLMKISEVYLHMVLKKRISFDFLGCSGFFKDHWPNLSLLKSKEAYASIGGGSPLQRITDEQANALKVALEKKILQAHIYVEKVYIWSFNYCQSVDYVPQL